MVDESIARGPLPFDESPSLNAPNALMHDSFCNNAYQKTNDELEKQYKYVSCRNNSQRIDFG